MQAGTIGQAFDEFLKKKTPKEWEREEVSQCRKRIHDVLDRRYGVYSFFQSGSFSNGTGISQKSDVDYFARLPLDRKTEYPSSLLESMKEALRENLWEASRVWISRPTVSIDFNRLVTQYEVTPAFYERLGRGSNEVFLIPGPGNTWRESSPRAHLNYVHDSNLKHGGKVKGLARLLKAWKYEHDVPISSFYLEMRAAQYGASKDSIFYPPALCDLVRSIINYEARSMNDPMGLVNRITACSSEQNRSTTLRKMKNHLPLLESAYEEWTKDNWMSSQRYRTVFGPDFPQVF
ncbi:hypothetical protein GCM10027160_39960 [Streptomyces calidiresistens]|uniref:Nucleotidyltransferase n=1 Tax=Streptomyces calidiresistens TaxID=1485586 RepID=A0A7W3T2Z8_9ACTN|nr:nucleotidyltransferase [Streptomyces calidiresistens]MBB0230010.1 nucleotidyltransferase [Streptomyces calidiresistens]